MCTIPSVIAKYITFDRILTKQNNPICVITAHNQIKTILYSNEER